MLDRRGVTNHGRCLTISILHLVTIMCQASAPPSTSPAPTTTDSSLEKTLDAAINEKGQLNNSVYGSYVPSSDKGSKYLSPKLNEIGKSEHKSSDTVGKGTHEEWPQRDGDTSEGARQWSGLGASLALLLLLILRGGNFALR